MKVRNVLDATFTTFILLFIEKFYNIILYEQKEENNL